MGFDVKAWNEAKRFGLAPKYAFAGITGAYECFSDAILSHPPFMDLKVREAVLGILENFGPFEKAWRTQVDQAVGERCEQYQEQTDDSEGAWQKYDELTQELLNDQAYRTEWVRTQVLANIEFIKADVRETAKRPDFPFRVKHPVEGVWSRSRDCVWPLVKLAGFCPKCHEVLAREDVWQKSGQWMMNCPACRMSGSIDEIERRSGAWPFHVLPFTDFPLRELVQTAARAA
jgi:hypothetical protein